MQIAIGSDHRGYKLKQKLIPYLKKLRHSVRDYGTRSEESCDYPNYSYAVAKAVASGACKKGIIICYTGIGSAIAANKVPGIRAGVSNNVLAAKMSRLHNDTNVLVLGAGFVAPKKAKDIIKVWLKTKFEGGRHLRRVRQIRQIEKMESR
ncbi:MAG: ribose 5-phosphate isomerase B [Candidatus Omnitrophota bacterium]